MAINAINAYLNFNGSGEQAVALYEKALGAKTETVQRFRDVPGTPDTAKYRDHIIHAMLRIGDSGVIMISDSMPDSPVKPGDSVHVCLHFDDVADMAEKFDALAQGGKVTMPLQDTFWGARYGQLTDAFGICWMFNCMLDKPA